MYTADLLYNLNPPKYTGWSLSSRVLKIQTLDKDKKVLRNASGFILKLDGKVALFTCWHVVTGLDFFDPKFTEPPRPKFIKIIGVDVSLTKKNKMNVRVGKNTLSIGGERTFIVPLYDVKDMPSWIQRSHNHRQNADLNGIGIFIPKLSDVVQIPIKLPPEIEALWSISLPENYYIAMEGEGESWRPKESLMDTMIISGYPYGYSALKNSPTPIFLPRTTASWATDALADTLLDHGGVPGMSGGPVWSSDNKFVGIYRGVVFPDSNPKHDPSYNNDKHAALGIISCWQSFILPEYTGKSDYL